MSGNIDVGVGGEFHDRHGASRPVGMPAAKEVKEHASSVSSMQTVPGALVDLEPVGYERLLAPALVMSGRESPLPVWRGGPPLRGSSFAYWVCSAVMSIRAPLLSRGWF